jgi:hypothetical protein
VLLSQPHFGGKCVEETHTPKSGNLESSETPATLELDSRGKSTLPWGFLYTVGKALKCRYRKWPRMNHLDICNTSYGRKKGRESNWQFNSRPQKFKNRPDPGVCRWGTTHRWKALEESYKIALDLIPIRGLSRELRAPKVLGVQTGTVSGLLLGGVPGIKAIWMRVCRSNTENTIWGKVVASPKSGPWWVKWVRVARGLSQHQKWRTPKFLIRPTWGYKYVELRKVGTWKPLPTSNTKGGKRGVLEVSGLD